MRDSETMSMLSSKGYKVEKLSPYQFRIECVFDLYPVRFRWHNIANGQCGNWSGLNEYHLCKLIDKHVAIADSILDAEIAAGRITPEGEMAGVRSRDVDSAIWWSKKGLQRNKAAKGQE